MRHPAGQGAQRLQLLGLAELPLGSVAGGDVVDHGEAVQKPSARWIAFGPRGEDDIRDLARALDQAILHRTAFAVRHGVDQFADRLLAIERRGTRIEKVGEGAADGLASV